MTSPTPQDVAAFLGRGDDPTVLAAAGEALPIVEAMARAYTRDKGFDDTDGPRADVAAVLVTATARLLGNPEQVDVTVGDWSVRGGFVGWSLAETFVLNRYRKMAM